MAQFIEFIVKNFFIVIVVVGFIASMIRKSKRSGTHRGGRMPDFGGGNGGGAFPSQMPQRPPEREPQRLEREPERRMPSAGRAPAMRPSEPLYGGDRAAPDEPSRTAYASASVASAADDGQARERSASRASERAARSQPRNSFEPERPDAGSAPRPGGFRAPDGDELRRAFVWAEVLGPPRSRKPLRRP